MRARLQRSCLTLAGIALSAALATTACTNDQAGDKTPEPIAWAKVDLPAGAEGVVLARHRSELLVGLRRRDAKVVPGLLIQKEDGSRQEVKVEPKSPYSFEATWRSIATDGDKILALGGAPGGAHSNIRWTVWSGSATALTEHPQEFNTFGGQTAGALYSAVITPSGQALTGSWGSTQSGLDAAIWLSQGTKWTRQDPAKTALQSKPELLVGPNHGTAAGDSIVLTGSQVRLAPNVVQQEAAVWRSTKLNQGWTRIPLPEPGNRSQGMTAACTAQLCTISGAVDGKLAIWQLEGDQAKRVPNVPAITVGDKDKVPPPIDDNGRLIQIVAEGDKVKVVTGDADRWTVQESSGPVGAVKDAALIGRSLYLLTGSGTLWKATLN